MSKSRVSELVFVIGLLIFTVIMGFMATGYTPRGRLFPLVVIVPVFLLLLIKIVMLIRPEFAGRFEVHGLDLPGSTPAETGGQQIIKTKWLTEVRIIAWLIALFVLILLLGFLYTIPLFLLSFLKFQGRHSWIISFACSAFVFGFIYLMFVMVLSVSFPEGLLFR